VTPGQPAPDMDCHDFSTRDAGPAGTAPAGAETLGPEALSLRHGCNPVRNALAEMIALAEFPGRKPLVRLACGGTRGRRARTQDVCPSWQHRVARHSKGEQR
jgi:hypothetical protein